MPRILVAIHADGAPSQGQAQWMEVDDAAGIRQRIATMLRAAASEDREAPGKIDVQGWSVLAYDGLPDFGPHPDVDELLAYLDAADDYGEPFEKLWASRRFDSALQAADAFADTYQGSYADAGAWARHYLVLMGEAIGSDSDFDAYGRAAVFKGDAWLITADSGGIHVFWND